MAFLERQARLLEQLDAEAFRHWLESLPDGTQVGVARDSHHCPLAQYLMQARGLSRVSVDRYAVLANYAEAPTPKPLAEFVLKVDEWPSGHPVSKQEALSLLSQED